MNTKLKVGATVAFPGTHSHGVILEVYKRKSKTSEAPWYDFDRLRIAWNDFSHGDDDMFRPSEVVRVCGNCFHEPDAHLGEKCLFGAGVWK